MQPLANKRTVRSYRDGGFHEIEDDVVTEYPVTIMLNEEEFATMVCSPEHLEDLVIGFLASEGVIRSFADIKSIQIDDKQGMAHVATHRTQRLNRKFYSKRYITSCCGKSRQSFYFYNDARTAKKITSQNVRLTVEACFSLMRQMQSSARLFQETGGVHNAALCDADGLLVSRMDIGRHNALDKIYGHCLRNGIDLQGKAIVFSGRISSEVLLKVAKIGCEIVLSKSAPTELALEMADELGITTVGFIRDGSLNVYTHPERITE